MATKRSFRKMLDQIDKFLSENDAEAVKLWDVLSALRGPDSDSYAVKCAFTEIIRTAALPLTSKLGIGLPATFALNDHQENVDIRNNQEPSHFRSHVLHAFSTLGLDPNKVNNL